MTDDQCSHRTFKGGTKRWRRNIYVYVCLCLCVCACVGDYAAAPFITLQIEDPCVDPFCLDLIKMLLEHSSS